MKTLYDVLNAIFESAEKAEYLASIDGVLGVSEWFFGFNLPLPLAESILRVGNKLQAAIDNGTANDTTWSWAKLELTCYMHAMSGDVQTVEMWRQDYESMPYEEWFGKEKDPCQDLDWLNDSVLVEVEYNTETKCWEQ